MGGRGASSGISKNGKPYGSEYKTVYQSDNIKFVKPNERNTTAPMETRSKNRIYVTLDYKDEPKFVSYYDKEGKRYKQIDLTGQAHKIDGVPTLPHTHMGYNHNENGDRVLNEEEKKIVARIKKAWYNKYNK